MSSRRRFLEFRKQNKNKEQNTGDNLSSAGFREYARLLKSRLGAIVGIFLMAIFSEGFGLLIPYGTRHVIDNVYTGDNMVDTLALWCGGLLAILAFGHLLDAFRSYRMTVLNSRVIRDIRARLFKHLLQLPVHRLESLKIGSIVSRLSSDITNITGLLQMALFSPGIAGLRIVATMIIVFTIQWQLAMVAMLCLPPLALVSLYWVRRVRPLYRSMAKDRSAVDGNVAEVFGAMRVVRNFSRERTESKRYLEDHHIILRKKIWVSIQEIAVDGAWDFFIPATGIAIIWFGGYLYSSGSATIGDIIAFQMYTAMLMMPVWRIVFSLSQIQRALASLDRVMSLLGESTEHNTGGDTVNHSWSAIQINDIYFTYPEDESEIINNEPKKQSGKNPQVISGVNFTVNRGETLAIVGTSGAGKSTLIDLLLRFYPLTNGKITLDSTDITTLDLDEYRALFAIVTQDVLLFDGSIWENICYANPTATEAEFWQAIKDAGLYDFTQELAEKENTVIGERGIRLSGGQKQRIAIARALLAARPILIFDEATSNLDVHTENTITEAIASLPVTKIIIAHRLTTVRNADKIIVLGDGRIQQTGTHESLLTTPGPYQELWNSVGLSDSALSGQLPN